MGAPSLVWASDQRHNMGKKKRSFFFSFTIVKKKVLFFHDREEKKKKKTIDGFFFFTIRPFANFGIFPRNGMMVKKKIISWKKSTFRAFPPGKSGRRALRARLPDSHRVERRRVSFAR